MSAAIVPPALRQVLEELLDAPITATQTVSGGSINRAARIQTKSETLFVKWNDLAPPGFFEAEARGLWALEASGAVRVPFVRWVGARQLAHQPPFLLLEWLEPASPADSKYFGWRLGEAWAQLHRHSAPLFGFETDNFIGRFVQPNPPRTQWLDFYRDHRLQPQIERAEQEKLLDRTRLDLLLAVVNRLEPLLADLESTPTLLHGDGWSGNVLCHRDASGMEIPVLIDPAVYFGEREMDIAYAELFGGFDAAFFEAYQANFPLQPGYERRRPLHQLYHLLNHLNHFGEEYGPWVDRVCLQLLHD